jgi:hypothetical protein
MMPVYNNNLSMHKDTSSFEHMRAHPSAAAPVQYQHDPRYTKAYAEQSVPLNSVLPHGSFMGLHQEQQRYDPRTAHYMNTMESAASTGYTPKHVQMDRNTAHYIPREMMKTGQSPYPHWTTHDHAAYSQQAAASYHHMADYGAHRDAYYHHAGPDVAGAPNMMYYQTGAYQTQPHQMQSMQQMTLL